MIWSHQFQLELDSESHSVHVKCICIAVDDLFGPVPRLKLHFGSHSATKLVSLSMQVRVDPTLSIRLCSSKPLAEVPLLTSYTLCSLQLAIPERLRYLVEPTDEMAVSLLIPYTQEFKSKHVN